jgi:hypothetical protein
VVSALLGALAWANTSVQVLAEPTELNVGQTGNLHVMLVQEGTQGATLASGVTPTLDVPAALDVRYRGLSQRFQSTGARIVSVFAFQYAVTALTEGEHVIGPPSVRLSDGSTVRGPAVTVRVKPPVKGDADDDELSLFAQFDETELWEGQLALYRYGLSSRVNGTRATWRLPAFDGLRAPQHGQPGERQFTVIDPDGTPITTVEGTVPLIATGTGTLTIDPAIASVTMGGSSRGWGLRFGPMREERRATDVVTLTVRPLPPAPPGFSGAVGEVAVSARLEREEAAVGESVGLVLTLESDGALEGLALPPYEPDGASVYADDDAVTGRLIDGGYRAVLRSRKVIVPTEEGELSLPPLEVVSFSPDRGEYVTHRVEVGSLSVKAGREGDGAVTSYAGDIDAELLEESPVVLEGPFTWGMASTPRIALATPILLLGAAAPGSFSLFGQGLVAVRRRWRARREAVEQGPPRPFAFLRGLPSDPEARLAAFDAALRQALANRQGVAVGALRRAEAIDALPDAVAEEVRVLTHLLDRARYGGGGGSAELESEVRRVVSLVEST